MMQFTLIICSLIISILFTQMKHPLAMGLMLLLQTFLISLISGSLVKSFWFSYILFLIMIGGMLVLFIYVTTLASNEMFSMSMKILIYSLGIILSSNLILMFFDYSMFNTLLMNSEMHLMSTNLNFIQENSINLNKLYNFPNNIMTLILINYLFLTLIIIVKITNNFMGPLRPMN